MTQSDVNYILNTPFGNQAQAMLNAGMSYPDIVALYEQWAEQSNIASVLSGTSPSDYAVIAPQPSTGYVMAMVPLTIEVVVQSIPWFIAVLKALGKILTYAQILEAVTGREFYSLDDVVEYLKGISGASGPISTGMYPPLSIVGVAKNPLDDPNNNLTGTTREGWIVEDIEVWEFGKKGSKKAWYKPYKDPLKSTTGSVMGFSERCAYFQGRRVQAYDSRQAKYRAYKRGLKDGVEQDDKDITNKEVLMALAGRK